MKKIFGRFLLTFRHFVSDNEPVHLYRIYNVCQRCILSDTLRASLVNGRRERKCSLSRGGFRLVWNDRDVVPEKVLDLWINGVYFHNDSAKREFLHKIAFHERLLLRNVFLNVLVDGTRHVLFVSHIIKAAIRDGLVRA